MIRSRLAPLVSAAASLAALALPCGVSPASAEACSDAEVVFARGTFAPPGLGNIGDDFVNDVRAKIGGKSLGAYAVVYPASTDFPTAIEGVRDTINHVNDVAARCPKTKLVLAGHSQGAAVIGLATNDVVPAGVDPAEAPRPLSPDVARHVAAVVLLGKPNVRFTDAINEPAVTIGPLFTGKTLELCAPGDLICSDGGDVSAHSSYSRVGLTDQGAAYAAGRV